MMVRYKTALRMFLIGLVLFLVMLKPVSQVEKIKIFNQSLFFTFCIKLTVIIHINSIYFVEFTDRFSKNYNQKT